MNHIIDIIKEMSHVYAKFLNQYKFNYHLTFLVITNKHGEENETISEIELPIASSISHNLTQSELNKLIIQRTLENRLKGVEMKESGWSFKKN